MAEFMADIDKWITKAKRNSKALVVASMLDVFSEIVRETNRMRIIKTGNYINSWWLTVGTPGQDPRSVGLDARPGDLGRTDSTPRIAMALGGYKLGAPLIFANGAAYGARLEYGFVGKDKLGRQYNQKPRPAVRTALSRAQAIVDAAGKRLTG